MTSRRAVLKGAAAALGVAGFPAIVRRVNAGEPVTLMTPFGFDSGFIELLNAYSGGHFERAGLDAKVLGGASTAQAFQQVLGGQAEFAFCSAIDLIRAIVAKGAPVEAIATVSQAQGFHLVGLKEKPVLDAEHIRGKTIGILSFGGTAETVTELILAKLGVKKSEVNLVVAGNNPGEVELIRQGRIDGFICNFSVFLTLRRMGQPIEDLSFDALVPNPGTSYWTRREIVEKKPELAQQVVRALKASVEEIIAGPLAPIYRRASQDFEIKGIKDLAMAVEIQAEVIARLWFAAGRENLMRNVPERWSQGVASLQAIGAIGATDPKTLYTNRFVEAA